MKAWGEAHRVAKRWAEKDPGIDARLQLARLERATGRGNPRDTVKKLAEEFPNDPQVQSALEHYAGAAVALR
jgi:hypothetical protein